MVRFNLRRRMQRRVSILRRCIRCYWDQMIVCSKGKPNRYLMLPCPIASPSPSPSPVTTIESLAPHRRSASDLVPLKVCLLGDCQIGKTSFLAKYVGKEKEKMQKKGLNRVDKTLFVGGARISFNIWELEGDEEYINQIPVVCGDSVAILIMFDLTSRRTLNSVINWYQQARKWNQTAIPILVGTKFDEFIQLPIDLQWTISSQARAYAKAINATLFFSSATYNINVNKIFKFITAKLFDLPWTVERNLTIGEPIIDF